MTASDEAGTPAGQHAAEPETSLGSALPPGSTATADAPQTVPPGGSQAAAPDDPEQLQREIEQTREHLGETLQELAARADVKSRARAKAADVSGRVKGAGVQAQDTAAARARSARSQLAGKTAAARQKAISAGGAGKDQLRGRVAAVGSPV